MNSRLKNTIVNQTTFQWRGHDNEFRLTGYYFIYKTSDGEKIYACVNRRCANGVSGVGVCGIILPLSEVKFLKRLSKYGLNESAHRKQMVKDDRHKYKFLKSLPEGLTKAQVDEIHINRVLRTAFKK